MPYDLEKSSVHSLFPSELMTWKITTDTSQFNASEFGCYDVRRVRSDVHARENTRLNSKLMFRMGLSIRYDIDVIHLCKAPAS